MSMETIKKNRKLMNIQMKLKNRMWMNMKMKMKLKNRKMMNMQMN